MSTKVPFGKSEKFYRWMVVDGGGGDSSPHNRQEVEDDGGPRDCA